MIRVMKACLLSGRSRPLGRARNTAKPAPARDGLNKGSAPEAAPREIAMADAPAPSQPDSSTAPPSGLPAKDAAVDVAAPPVEPGMTASASASAALAGQAELASGEYQQGYRAGREDGKRQGWQDGYEQGMQDRLAQARGEAAELLSRAERLAGVEDAIGQASQAWQA